MMVVPQFVMSSLNKIIYRVFVFTIKFNDVTKFSNKLIHMSSPKPSISSLNSNDCEKQTMKPPLCDTNDQNLDRNGQSPYSNQMFGMPMNPMMMGMPMNPMMMGMPMNPMMMGMLMNPMMMRMPINVVVNIYEGKKLKSSNYQNLLSFNNQSINNNQETKKNDKSNKNEKSKKHEKRKKHEKSNKNEKSCKIEKKNKNKKSNKINSDNEENNQKEVITISHKENNDFDGIIKYLEKKYGNNLHQKRIISISASSTLSNGPQFSPEHVINYTNNYNNTFWMSDNNPGNWLELDFKNIKLKLTGYSLKTSNGPISQAHHIKNWILEGSQDGIEWNEIDRQENNNDLNGPNYQHYFPISDSDEEYQYIRIKSIGQSHYVVDQSPYFEEMNEAIQDEIMENPEILQNPQDLQDLMSRHGFSNQTFYFLMFSNIEFFGEIQTTKNN